MNFQEFKQTYQKVEPEEFPNNVEAKPLVSICVQTFQHVDYIKDCLEGILAQKTTFPFEILLGEDYSTDGTRDICIAYAKEFPNKIKLFLHQRENNIKIGENSTGRFNFLYNVFSSQGKYIALCEGDDFWTDDYKLQKQVDFLEKNNDYGICFHETKVLWDDSNKSLAVSLNRDFPWNNMSQDRTVYYMADVLKGPFMATASVMIRRELFPDKFPSWINEAYSGDITFYAIILGDYKVKYLNEVMAVYRRHSGGITRLHKNNKVLVNRIYILNEINQYYDFKYEQLIKVSMKDYILSLKKISLNELGFLGELYRNTRLISNKTFFKLLGNWLR